MMKLRHLQFAEAIARNRSFSKAAKECNATQPTLSNALTQLEEELGGKLFKRTTRSVELTPFGAFLMPYLTSVTSAQQELQAAALAFRKPAHKLLRIGFSPLVDITLLNRVLEPFFRKHPTVKVFFKECLLDDLNQRLDAGTIDVVVVPRQQGVAVRHSFPFYRDRLKYIPSADTPAQAGSGPLPLGKLPQAPVILTGGGCGLNGTLEDLFERQGARFDAYPGQALTYQVIEEWAELGIGAGILPAAKLSAGNHRAIPLVLKDGSPAMFEFEWQWRSPVAAQRHLADFVGYIRETVPALVAGDGRAVALPA
ncbi:MAG: LysR family transcriptional regulator [Nitratireductor sp.]|nr:LysR family transcriptional regulator [Nitratireductor sp.]